MMQLKSVGLTPDIHREASTLAGYGGKFVHRGFLAPYVIKAASAGTIEKWPEMAAFRDCEAQIQGVSILWAPVT